MARKAPRGRSKRGLFPYISLREQADGTIRPRFEPGPRERKLGERGRDLRHDNGAWFSLDEVRTWSHARRDAIAAARIAGGKRRRTPAAAKGTTVADLLDGWMKSADVQDALAAKTIESYRKAVEAVKWKPLPDAAPKDTPRERELFSQMPAAAVTHKTARAFVLAAVKSRGWFMAMAMKAALSAAFTWSLSSIDWDIPANPILSLNLKTPKALRDRQPITWSIAEFLAAWRYGDHPGIAADLNGPDMVDAIFLLLFSGQRPEEAPHFTGGAVVDVIDPVTGRTVPTVRLIQSKTSKAVSVPAGKHLQERLRAMQARRLARGCDVPTLLVRPRERALQRRGARFSPWTEDGLRKAFAVFVEAVAKGRPDLGLAPCPSISGKRLKHLRKTFVTWAKAAGVDLAGIAAVTGHELQSLNVVDHHYLYQAEAAARATIGALENWLDVQGVAG